MQNDDPLEIEVSKGELINIHNAKLKIIEDTYEYLYVLGSTFRWWDSFMEKLDFMSSVKAVKDMFYRPIETKGKINPPKYMSFLKPHLLERYKKDVPLELTELLFSEEYKPPTDTDIRPILMHLKALWVNYSLANPLTLNNLRLDLSLIKLIGTARELISTLEQKGKRDLARLRESKSKVRDKVDKKKTYVFEIYYKSQKIMDGMKLNGVAKAIDEVFRERKLQGQIPKNIKPPSTDQIKRYLWGDKMIRNDFQKVGRYWIMQT